MHKTGEYSSGVQKEAFKFWSDTTVTPIWSDTTEASWGTHTKFQVLSHIPCPKAHEGGVVASTRCTMGRDRTGRVCAEISNSAPGLSAAKPTSFSFLASTHHFKWFM